MFWCQPVLGGTWLLWPRPLRFVRPGTLEGKIRLTKQNLDVDLQGHISPTFPSYEECSRAFEAHLTRRRRCRTGDPASLARLHVVISMTHRPATINSMKLLDGDQPVD